ncbi:MAG: hypothetical protein MK008_06720 [Bdellovibrionales bacterium]|nr:hypothetical protein [Bdellovibrionales bacterium]
MIKQGVFIKYFIFIFIAIILSSCTTTGPSKKTTSGTRIDLQKVQEELGIQYYGKQYGIAEIPFNTCNISSYPTGSRCEMKTFIYVRFRVRCRNSMDTVDQVRASDIRNLANSKIRWRLGPYEGTSYLNSKGVTEVRMISTGTLRASRFVIFSGNNYLGIRVNELKQIVVPSDWC